MAVIHQECVGCTENFYNQTQPNGCWNFATAKKVERTQIGVWWNPPYNWRPQQVLSCHHPDGMVWLEKADVRFKHNWTR